MDKEYKDGFDTPPTDEVYKVGDLILLKTRTGTWVARVEGKVDKIEEMRNES